MYTLLGIFDKGWWTACTKDATFEILLMLLAAGIIGWLLRRFWSGDIKKINNDWQLKYDKLSHDFNNAGKNTKNLKAEIEGLNLKLSKSGNATAEFDNLKAKFENVQVQYEKVQAELASTRKEYAAEHEKLMAALKPAGEIEILNNRMANMTEEMEILKKNAETYKTSLGAAIAEKAKLAASVQVNEADELRKKVNRLENDLNSSRLMVTKYQDESRKMDEKKAKLDEETKLLNEQMTELEGLKTKLTRAEEDITRLRNGLTEFNQLRLDFDAMKVEKEKWQMEADVQANNAAEALTWRDKALAFEKEIASAKAAVGEMDIIKDKLIALEAENQKLSASIQKNELVADESEALKNRIRILESENATFKITVNNASSASMELDGLNKKLQVLEADLTGSKKEYSELLKNYEALEAEKKNMVLASAPIKYDDLEVIEGVGPKIEKLLYKGGIYTYCQLAETSPGAISEILMREGGEHYRIHDPATWPEQAALLCAGKKEEFEKLATELKGGKRVNESANNKDDLKVVEGIGPKIEELLNRAGIFTFKNLADAPVEMLKEVLTNAGDKYKMHDPTSWPQQAILLSDGKMDEFQKLTDSLKGGRIA